MFQRRFFIALKAFGVHMMVSLAVASLAAGLVFFVWYPHPYERIQGGLELFLLVVGVDVVCGPLLTFVVFSSEKVRRILILDLGLVFLVQLGALTYGLYTVWLARPIYMVYEIDRYRVVSRADVDDHEMKNAFGVIPPPRWIGVQLLGIRVAKPTDTDYLDELTKSLGGLYAAHRPDRWIPYEDVRSQVLSRARRLDDLMVRHPETKKTLEDAAKRTGFKEEQLRWMPVQSRWGTEWSVLLSAESAEVLGFVHIDGL